MSRKKLYLIPVHLPDGAVLEPLLSYLAHAFRLEAEILRKEIDVSSAYDKGRNQYYSTAILARILKEPPDDAFRVLGVTDLDIFIPVLTYLFGEAQLKGPGALVSICRLRNEFYGRAADPQLFQERLLKEAVHELGHTYGLTHCIHPGCVMNSSTYIEDVDEKGVVFCRDCAEEVDRLETV